MFRIVSNSEMVGVESCIDMIVVIESVNCISGSVMTLFTDGVARVRLVVSLEISEASCCKGVSVVS